MEHGTYYRRGNRQFLGGREFFRPKRSDEVLTNPARNNDWRRDGDGDLPGL
jgi:hypothetical protein